MRNRFACNLGCLWSNRYKWPLWCLKWAQASCPPLIAECHAVAHIFSWTLLMAILLYTAQKGTSPSFSLNEGKVSPSHCQKIAMSPTLRKARSSPHILQSHVVVAPKPSLLKVSSPPAHTCHEDSPSSTLLKKVRSPRHCTKSRHGSLCERSGQSVSCDIDSIFWKKSFLNGRAS